MLIGDYKLFDYKDKKNISKRCFLIRKINSRIRNNSFLRS